MSAGYSKSVSDDVYLICHPPIHGSSMGSKNKQVMLR